MNGDYYEQLKNTVMNATQNSAPETALGGMPELQQFYQIPFQSMSSDAAMAPMAYNTGTEMDNRRAAEAAARAAASSRSSGKYRRERKDDGGFAFFDPDGNEISAYEFANANGTSPADVLADSENPLDWQYIKDFSGLQDYYNVWFNGDEEAASMYRELNPELNDFNNPVDMMNEFRRRYPTVYGYTNRGQEMGSYFIRQPSGDGGDYSGYGL